MTRTIGNPLSWSVDRVGEASQHIRSVSETLGGDAQATDTVASISTPFAVLVSSGTIFLRCTLRSMC